MLETDDYPPYDADYDPEEVRYDIGTDEKWCIGEGCFQRKNHEPES